MRDSSSKTPGVALPEQRREPPGGGRFPPVEQPGFRHDEGADAGRADGHAARMPCPQLRRGETDIRTCERRDQLCRHGGAERGHDHPVGLHIRRDGGYRDRHSLTGTHAAAHAHTTDTSKRGVPPISQAAKRWASPNASRITGEAGVKQSIEREDGDTHGVNDLKDGSYDATERAMRELDIDRRLINQQPAHRAMDMPIYLTIQNFLEHSTRQSAA